MSPHWLAQCHAKWLRRCTAFQNTSGIKPRLPDAVLLTLTTKPLVRINYSKKTIYELWVELSNFTMSCRISPPATYFFCIQDCSSQIVQVEYQGQTRNTRILERKPLINTSYHIRQRLDLKYFHFAQFWLSAHLAAHWPWKSRTENLKFRTDLRDRVLDGWSVTQ